MGENYVEQLVKQKMTTKSMLILAGLVFLSFVSVVVGLFILPGMFIIPVIVIFAAYYFGKRFTSLEYEYVYYNGEVDIDRIMGMEARKRFITISAKDMEILAPSGSSALQPYKNLKVYDCSSNSGAHTYEVVTKKKEQNVRIIFEPNKEILDGMRLFAPRKVLL